MKKLVVILDAAHGKETAGKRSPDGTHREYKWSRDICNILYHILVNRGYKVVMDYPSDDTEPGLTNRANYANSVEGEYRLFLSFHNNAASNSNTWTTANGFELWTSLTKKAGYEWADKLAEKWALIIIDRLQRDFPTTRLRKDTATDAVKDKDFTVLYLTEMPAILIEWMFQDNRQEVASLDNPNQQTLFCASIANAIEQINNTL